MDYDIRNACSGQGTVFWDFLESIGLQSYLDRINLYRIYLFLSKYGQKQKGKSTCTSEAIFWNKWNHWKPLKMEKEVQLTISQEVESNISKYIVQSGWT